MFSDSEKAGLREVQKREGDFYSCVLLHNPATVPTYDTRTVVHYCDTGGLDVYLYPPESRAAECFAHPLEWAREIMHSGRFPRALPARLNVAA